MEPVLQDVSLGEVQALCVKAALGAGRAVGVAEDAGRAVRWLQGRGLAGAAALEQLLQATDGLPARDMIPDLPAMTPLQTALCPLALGGYLSDTGDVPGGPIGPIWSPLLLLPFLADIWPGGADLVPEVTGPEDTGLDLAVIRLHPRPDTRPVTHSRAQLSGNTLESLRTFAARTYAPATAQSRASGAGAGLSDND